MLLHVAKNCKRSVYQKFRNLCIVPAPPVATHKAPLMPIEGTIHFLYGYVRAVLVSPFHIQDFQCCSYATSNMSIALYRRSLPFLIRLIMGNAHKIEYVLMLMWARLLNYHPWIHPYPACRGARSHVKPCRATW